ncbi:MAG: hypothetical protein KAR20_23955, partial [Candidatus Heimdallarchaeota archaeon]|nr:hypothetical protein [Candidatus Heimdallarchaeota archaeon]
MLRNLWYYLQAIWWTILHIPSELKEFRQSDEYKNIGKEIEGYWDEKTTFVHRRAVKLGLFGGLLIGTWLGASGILVVYLIEVEGYSLLDALIKLFTW